MEKITEEQLKQLQELVGTINNAQTQLGGIEMQKHQLLHQVSEVQTKLNEVQAELEKEYGKVSINLQDGTITKDEESTEE
jgi:chaperonin cofactor prefoldin